MPTNYIPKCLREIPKAKRVPRNQAIRQAKIEAYNEAIRIISDKCRIEKNDRMKCNIYNAMSEISRLRDAL